MNEAVSIVCAADSESIGSDGVVIRVSDESLDRMGTIIRTNGFELENYLKNPVVLNGHGVHDIIDVIGRASRTWTESDGLYQEWRFASQANPKAAIAAALYRGGFCRAASVRIIPKEWIEGYPGKDPFRIMYLRHELTEVSACGVPLNPNTLARALQVVGASPVLIDAARSLPALRHAPLNCGPDWAALAREVAGAAERMNNQRA